MLRWGVVLVGVVAACESKSAAPAKARPAPAPRDAVAAVADAARDAPTVRPKLFVHGSGRCGECHEKMFDEWEVSAHARAMSSPLYATAAAQAKDPTCVRCHAPLEEPTRGSGIADEGVTCDVCHTLRAPVPAVTGAGFRLAIDDMVKYGPRCDLDDHYFHRMGCSPEHREATLCGTCHWWEPRGLPVLTEFTDWRDGPAAKAGTPCQGCHMPKDRAAIATGSPTRAGVPHHGLLGLAGDLRARAVALVVAARAQDGQVVVDVAVTNANAGHYLPAGLPERRLVITARTVDGAGAEVDTAARWLGRTLVDATGTHVPFWRATRLASDTRLAPNATWNDTFSLRAPAAGAVEVEVSYRGLAPEIATALAVTDVETHVFARAQIAFGAPTATGRAKLPRTVKIAPPAAGKRRKAKR